MDKKIRESGLFGITAKLIAVAICLGGFLLEGAEIFHFDFRNADGKKELKSGEVVLKSKRVPLLVQKNCLRLAPVPEIEITGKLPDLTRQFSVSAWVFNKRGPDSNPILSRGKHGSSQFLFTTGPGFYTQFENRITGINVNARMPSPSHWHQLTATYDRGEYKMYVDGKLFGTGKGLSRLPSSDEPLLVGIEANCVRGAQLPFTHANMLLNDLHLWDHALSAEEIRKVYESERGAYPAGSQIPATTYPWQAIPPCLHYMPEGFDPALLKELPLTKQYQPDQKEVAFRVRTSRIKGDPGAAPRLLRGLAEYCGIHIWLDTEDAFGANDSLIMLHAASAGTKTVKLPRKATIRDARTLKVIGKNSDNFKVHLDKYENGVYILE